MLAQSNTSLTSWRTDRNWQLPLCVPQSARQELESTNLRIIKEAAASFARMSAPPNSSCWLQAKFLRNILHEYDRFGRQERQTTSQNQLANTSSTNMQVPSDTNVDTAVTGTKSMAVRHTASEERVGDLPHHQNRIPLTTNHPEQLIMEGCDANEEPFVSTALCWDDELWEQMFANAGFSIAEGILLAENHYN